MGSPWQCPQHLTHIGYLLPKAGPYIYIQMEFRKQDCKCKGPRVEHGFGKVPRKGLTDGMWPKMMGGGGVCASAGHTVLCQEKDCTLM